MRSKTDVFKDCESNEEQALAMLTDSGKVMLFVDENSVTLDTEQIKELTRQLLEMCGQE